MREVEVSRLTDVIEKLCIEANEHLPEDVKCAIKTCRACEDGEIAKGILDNIIENFDIADNENVPICQDTGMACVFLEIGQDVHFVGGDLTDAINEGVRRGYDKGYLRKSVVKDPVRRGNTGDNTPAMIYTEIVPGDQVKITVGPKGFGSENMSQIRMFKPSAGLQGIKDFILEVVETAGPNPCPPMVVGVGIGGTFDKCALLAKKALMRPLDTQNPDPFYADLEKEMLEKVNKLGIGPQGFGGKTTAIGLNIETMPTHIAGMPCAVNINCHVTRHKSEVIFIGDQFGLFDAFCKKRTCTADSSEVYTIIFLHGVYYFRKAGTFTDHSSCSHRHHCGCIGIHTSAGCRTCGADDCAWFCRSWSYIVDGCICRIKWNFFPFCKGLTHSLVSCIT